MSVIVDSAHKYFSNSDRTKPFENFITIFFVLAQQQQKQSILLLSNGPLKWLLLIGNQFSSEKKKSVVS